MYYGIDLAAREVIVPHPAKPFGHHADRLVPGVFEVAAPRSESAGIVKAQDFDVGDEQARLLR